MRKMPIAGAAMLAAAGIAAAQAPVAQPPPAAAVTTPLRTAPPIVISRAQPPTLAVQRKRVPPNLEARAIPDVLLAQIRTGSTIERYVADIVGKLRAADPGGDGLDRADLDLRRQRDAAAMRASQVTEVLRYDLDGDFIVTRGELERGFQGQDDYRERGIARLLERYDTDGNGAITLKEAAADPRMRQSDPAPAALLALDPDGNGKLTADELGPMAEHAFRLVDRDGDGVISQDEDAAIAEQRDLARWLSGHPACPLPDVPTGARTVAYGAYEGDAISSAAVGGANQETNLTDVVIEPGREPLYLFLSSYESMVWRVKGDTGRVARVVVHAWQGAEPPAGSAAISASGVTGIPAANVTVVDHDCFEYFDRPGAEQSDRSLALIERALGRKPDAVFGSYSAQSVALPSGTVVHAEREAALLPKGFDPRVWQDATRYWEAGLVAVDPKAVVARAKVEAYKVLPSQMGLAQLVGSGAAEYLSGDQFRIVKPIPHLPPRMTGAHLATLILAKGVPLPPGDPGHSCIVSEETGERVAKGPICHTPSE
jgi:hypothetical protein